MCVCVFGVKTQLTEERWSNKRSGGKGKKKGTRKQLSNLMRILGRNNNGMQRRQMSVHESSKSIQRLQRLRVHCWWWWLFFYFYFLKKLFRLRFKLRGTKARTIVKYNTRRRPLRVEETKSDARKGRHKRERAREATTTRKELLLRLLLP